MSSPNSKVQLVERVAKSRARADTSALLPPGFDAISEDTMATLVPEKSIGAYTQERLQESLAYAEMFLHRRDISPRSETFMQIFKDELKEAIQADDPKDKIASSITICAYENLIKKNAFLGVEQFEKERALQGHMLEFRSLQYVARYGDYAKIFPTKLRLYAVKDKTDDWTLLSGNNYWSAIADQLFDEDVQFQRTLINRTLKASREVHAAVHSACHQIGISTELATWSIIAYGRRNSLLHRNLDQLKEEGNYTRFAEVLYEDLADIDCVFSELHNETDKTNLRILVQTEIHKWFDIGSRIQDYRSWLPKPELREFYLKAQAAKNKPTNAEQKKINIEENGQRSKEKADRQKISSITSSPATGKRIASTKEPRGSEKATYKRRMRTREQLVAKKCKLELQVEYIKKELAKSDKQELGGQELDSGCQ
ncbi:MAG: hypothetical protein M1824_001909 [Vezdaea acicularis]|nr:MAG: hypothetical protein M1824_001909 [Vezdaea acicularis]